MRAAARVLLPFRTDANPDKGNQARPGFHDVLLGTGLRPKYGACFSEPAFSNPQARGRFEREELGSPNTRRAAKKSDWLGLKSVLTPSLCAFSATRSKRLPSGRAPLQTATGQPVLSRPTSLYGSISTSLPAVGPTLMASIVENRFIRFRPYYESEHEVCQQDLLLGLLQLVPVRP